MRRRRISIAAWWLSVADPHGSISGDTAWRVRSVAAFVVLVIVCAALLAATASVTRDRIEHNRNRQFLDLVQTLIGGTPPEQLTWERDVARLCDGRALLRGRSAGYAGAIHWLAAADVTAAAPRLSGLRITAHQETPGIADFLDRPARGWLASLHGLDASAIAAVDTVTGATVTSRTVRGALAERLMDPALLTECAP
jgi:Na+-translocating ferredoxin:NAD+ oxidoreductase RnfG subunit